jgi:hypothetical protein
MSETPEVGTPGYTASFSPITTMTLAERRSAERAWLRQTTLRQRIEVMRYIKKGQVHPDPDLAARCYRWAKGETQFNIYRNTRAGLRVILATSLVPGLSQGVFKLRTARRIVEVSERHLAVSKPPHARTDRPEPGHRPEAGH